MAQAFKNSDLEILLSTMDRDSLDFLMPMFPFTSFHDYQILIINQTTPEKLLNSDYANIRVINSFERGLSKSRNLALKNAQGKIGLITDDDVVFVKDFDSLVINGFNTFTGAALIKFCAATFGGKLFRKYSKHPVKQMNASQRLNTMSIEVAVNTKYINKSGVVFNTLFGLGGYFSMGEEPIFVNELHDSGYQTSFIPEIIVTHKAVKDSDNIPVNEVYRVRGAYLKKIFKNKWLFWVVLQIMYHLKARIIAFKQLPYCIKHAQLGSRQLQTLENNENHLS